MCFSAIHWSRIRAIYMGTRIADVAALGFSELPVSNEMLNELGGLKIRLVTGVAEEACRQLLADWQQQSQATAY